MFLLSPLIKMTAPVDIFRLGYSPEARRVKLSTGIAQDRDIVALTVMLLGGSERDSHIKEEILCASLL